MVRRLLLLSVLLVSGCAWPVRDAPTRWCVKWSNHPFDVAPEAATEARAPAQPATGGITPANVGSDGSTPVGARRSQPSSRPPPGWKRSRDSSRPAVPLKDDAVQTVAWTQPQPGPGGPSPPPGRYQLTVPPKVPGSEAPRIVLPRDTAAAAREIDRLYPDLPPLPVRAGCAAGARREALYAGRLPAPGRRQQPDHRPGCLGCRSGQGKPDPGQDLPQSQNRLLADTDECEQHGRHDRRSHRPAHHHGGQTEARLGRGPEGPGQRHPGPEACSQRPLHRRPQRLFHGARRCRDPGGDPGAGAVQR